MHTCWLIVLLAFFTQAVTAQPGTNNGCPGPAPSPFAPNGTSMPNGQPMTDLLAGKNALEQQVRNLQEYCPDGQSLMRRAQQNLEAVRANKRALETIYQRLLREGEISFTLPRTCQATLNCCPGGRCCEDLDPCTYEDFLQYLDRIRCLENTAFQAAAAGYGSFATGGDLLERWYSGQDHREVMGAYNDIFRAMESLFNFFDEALAQLSELSDGLRQKLLGDLRSALQDIAIEEFREVATPDQWRRFQQLQASLKTAGEVREALSLVKDIVKRGTTGAAPNPAWLFKLNAALYGAAANMTQSAVDGWKEYGYTMGKQLIEAYQHYLCAEQFYLQYLAILERCGSFCESAFRCHRDRLIAVKEQIKAQRNAAELLKDQANQDIQKVFDGVISTDFCRALCEAGFTAGRKAIIPTPGHPLLDRLSAALKARFGRAYCFMRIAVWAECTPTGGCRYRYEVMFSEGSPFHEDCCRDIPNPPDQGSSGNTGPITRPEHPPGIGEGINRDRDLERTDRTTRPVPGRPDDPDDPTKNPPGDCGCVTPQVRLNGGIVRPNAVVNQVAGSTLRIQANGTCKGTACNPVQTLLWITQPGAARSTRHGAATKLLLQRPGRYRIMAQQICGPDVCPMTFFVQVKPGTTRDQPSRPILVSPQPPSGCGNARCVQVSWNVQGSPNKVQVGTDHQIALSRPMAIVLRESNSQCFGQRPRLVQWIFTGPDGRVITRQGPGVAHEFIPGGTWTVCVELTGPKGRVVSRSIKVTTNAGVKR
jgi:hypothetical protein